ncbi:hypothetical protein EJB05_30349, partial [Eragrostis curvula]
MATACMHDAYISRATTDPLFIISVSRLAASSTTAQLQSKRSEGLCTHARMEVTAAMRGGKGKGMVVVVMGATATGKSKLAVDLALRFGGEVINSDKIQVHDGLDVVTNKVTADERRGVPHHLIGGVRPDADYSAADFCRDAARAVESVLSRGRVPVIAGGSNRYLEALLDSTRFRRRYECCFLWVDADLPVLRRYIGQRVDCMLEQGLVDETREFFRPNGDYSRGIYKSIGVPEMDTYFRLETAGAFDGDEQLRVRVLAAGVARIKANTCTLACRQLRKIHRLQTLPGWSLRRLDVTAALSLKVAGVKKVDPGAERAAWEADVAGPATSVVAAFLRGETDNGGFVAPAATKEVAGSGTAAELCGRQLGKAAAVVARGRGFVAMVDQAAAVV